MSDFQFFGQASPDTQHWDPSAVPYTASDVASAAFAYGQATNTTAAVEGLANRTSPTISGDVANQKYGIKNDSPDFSLSWKPDEQVPEAVAQQSNAVMRAKMQLATEMSRSPNTTAAIAGSLAGGLADPVAVASSFIPFSWIGKGAELGAAAANLDRVATAARAVNDIFHATAIGRIGGAALQNGATVGALEPLMASQAAQTHQDYTFADASWNVMSAAILGGGLHGIGEGLGALGRAFRGAMGDPELAQALNPVRGADGDPSLSGLQPDTPGGNLASDPAKGIQAPEEAPELPQGLDVRPLEEKPNIPYEEQPGQTPDDTGINREPFESEDAIAEDNQALDVRRNAAQANPIGLDSGIAGGDEAEHGALKQLFAQSEERGVSPERIIWQAAQEASGEDRGGTRLDSGQARAVSDALDKGGQYLLDFAHKHGLYLHPAAISKIRTLFHQFESPSAEHWVFHDRENQRVIKINKDLDISGGNREYIKNLADNNLVFPGLNDYKILGVTKDVWDMPLWVTSSKYVGGKEVNTAELEALLKAKGFERGGPGTFLNEWTHKDSGLVIGDANTGNLKKTPEGKLIPFDIQIVRRPGRNLDPEFKNVSAEGLENRQTELESKLQDANHEVGEAYREYTHDPSPENHSQLLDLNDNLTEIHGELAKVKDEIRNRAIEPGPHPDFNEALPRNARFSHLTDSEVGVKYKVALDDLKVKQAAHYDAVQKQTAAEDAMGQSGNPAALFKAVRKAHNDKVKAITELDAAKREANDLHQEVATRSEVRPDPKITTATAISIIKARAQGLDGSIDAEAMAQDLRKADPNFVKRDLQDAGQTPSASDIAQEVQKRQQAIQDKIKGDQYLPKPIKSDPSPPPPENPDKLLKSISDNDFKTASEELEKGFSDLEEKAAPTPKEKEELSQMDAKIAQRESILQSLVSCVQGK